MKAEGNRSENYRKELRKLAMRNAGWKKSKEGRAALSFSFCY